MAQRTAAETEILHGALIEMNRPSDPDQTPPPDNTAGVQQLSVVTQQLAAMAEVQQQLVSQLTTTGLRMADMMSLLRDTLSQVTAIDTNLTAKITAIDSNLTDKITAINTNLTAIDNNLTDKIASIDNNLTDKIPAIDPNLTAIDNNLTDKITDIDTNLMERITAIDKNLTERITAIGTNLTERVTAVGNHLTKVNYTTIRTPRFTFGKEGNGHGEFNVPFGVAINNEGHVFVADHDNHRIQIIRPDGVFIRQVGERGSKAGQFYFPHAVCVGRDGNIVVADTVNHRVHVLRPNGVNVRTFGSGRGAAKGQFDQPAGCTTFQHRRKGPCLVVAEYANHRLQVIPLNGAAPYTIGKEGKGQEEFSYPRGIAVSRDQQMLFVADHSNNRIQVVTVDGDFQLSFGSHGTGAGQLNDPWDVAVDHHGNILVADWGNNRIQVFSHRDYSFIASFGSGGQLVRPRGIAVASDGAVYVSSEHKMSVY